MQETTKAARDITRKVTIKVDTHWPTRELIITLYRFSSPKYELINLLQSRRMIRKLQSTRKRN